MIDYAHYFTSQIEKLKQEGNYRVFRDLERIAGKFPHATYYEEKKLPKEIVIWCSVDYLGMGQHPIVQSAMIDAIQKMGNGSGGSRNIGGNSHPHVLLEKELALLHGKESALLFTSGYVANQASLVALGKILPKCVFLSDSANHASLIEGIRFSRCDKQIFRYNDVKDLEDKLKTIPIDQPKIIVFEALYSMDGDVAPLREFVELAEAYHALTYLDEVHAVGVYGKTAGGLSEQEGLSDRITIIQGSLAKAFGVYGGYISGSGPIVDAIRSLAYSFIFTVSLPPAISAGALASIKYLRTHEDERKKLFHNASQLKKKLQDAGLSVMLNTSYITPVLIGDPVRCQKVSLRLLNDFGIYIQPINYPTVPWGTERLRITPTPQHTDQDIDNLVNALKTVLKE